MLPDLLSFSSNFWDSQIGRGSQEEEFTENIQDIFLEQYVVNPANDQTIIDLVVYDEIRFRMFSQSFVMLSILLLMSFVSLKAHEVKGERFVSSYSNKKSTAKMAEEEMNQLLAVRILDPSLGTPMAAEGSNWSPDRSHVKRKDPVMGRSHSKVTYWPRRTFTLPFQYTFDVQRGREMLLSRRNSKDTRFSLSLDVPTNILSILIDLAKAKDMRAKAAANAALMAQIGK
ncbi:urocortin-3-like [Rhincodon typus]|uniref:urocortin-3-like n=1 Tax=Rhincodon typus TaxID=259920 RepID=UPI0020305A1A|nr:urocortin-3-like [Rhincodon typus]